MTSIWRASEMLRLVFYIFPLMGGALSTLPPVVEIGNGLLQGTYYQTINDRDVLAFLGVPFAEPPVGNMRFRPPLAVRGWQGIKVVNDTRPPCLQYNHYLSAIGKKPIIGYEDCLYLDVYTPRLPSRGDRLTEVVVFVHGGAFTYGSKNGFNPKYLLAEKELVLVVISYRVGPFGFLSTGDEVVTGNMGMKDQTEALKWVNRNIDRFGGDPEKVTLAGLSAGGASVHFHYFSPESRRYFKQGISLSGTALCPWALMESPREKMTILSNAVGCPTNTTSQVTIECLRERPGELILYRMHSTLMPWLFNPISPFAPTIEIKGPRSFLEDHPEKLLREGKVYDAPWLVGFTSGEGFYPASEFVLDERLMNDLNNNWTIIAPHLLDFNYTEPDSDMRTAKSVKIKDYYVKGNFLSKDSTLDVIEMVSDRMYLSAIDKAVRLQAKVNKSPVYVYNFAYRGRNTLWEQFAGMKTDMGAGHGDDVAYVLGAYFSCTDSDDDRKMVDTMVGVWSSYAKQSQPAPVAGETWMLQLGDKNVSFLLIESSEKASMASSNQLGNTEFWDTLLSAELASSTRRHDEF
uniref:Carboxylic ester hydrolase n=2 Tax=Laodelphax striatellus TaxID=195883 RepID=A0A4Y6HRH1_LAOST|nr:carboxylesterase [Laodelphax striatellus]